MCLGIFNKGDKIHFVLLKKHILIKADIKVRVKVFTQRFNNSGQVWEN